MVHACNILESWHVAAYERCGIKYVNFSVTATIIEEQFFIWNKSNENIK